MYSIYALINLSSFYPILWFCFDFDS